MLSCSIWFSAPSFWMGGGLDSRCLGRVYGADGARHHPHRTHDLRPIIPQTSVSTPYEVKKRSQAMNILKDVQLPFAKLFVKQVQSPLSNAVDNMHKSTTNPQCTG